MIFSLPLPLSLLLCTLASLRTLPPILRRPGDHTLPPLSLTHFTSSSITPFYNLNLSAAIVIDNHSRLSRSVYPRVTSICSVVATLCESYVTIRAIKADVSLFTDRNRQISFESIAHEKKKIEYELVSLARPEIKVENIYHSAQNNLSKSIILIARNLPRYYLVLR